MEREPRQNTFANNLKGEKKHISEVESGRKGYYCIGCGGEVEARKGKIMLTHYFAHVPTDVKIERQCTYSDETYRHKIAKEILQRIKQIKVPALYKYANSKEMDNPRTIRKAWTIVADNVKIERQFYENEEGEIRYGQNLDFDADTKKHLLIQPDVAFFDEDNNPILLIEIVATHDITPDKLTKIKRLGIDTIQIRVPKTSEADIEKSFYNSSRTKWIFNNEKEETNYSSLPKGTNEGVLQIDKFQRRILRTEETFDCRSSQIKNLIRGFRKTLESEQYRRVERTLGDEIIRVEKNTRRNKEQLNRIQEQHKRAIQEEFRLEENALKQQEAEFNRRAGEEQAKDRNLERRYKRRKQEIILIHINYLY